MKLVHEAKATLTLERVENNGFRATLSVPYNGHGCVFTEVYVVTGYEKRHAVDRAREVAGMLGWTITPSNGG